jgi:hypothetical protein
MKQEFTVTGEKGSYTGFITVKFNTGINSYTSFASFSNGHNGEAILHYTPIHTVVASIAGHKSVQVYEERTADTTLMNTIDKISYLLNLRLKHLATGIPETDHYYTLKEQGFE